MSSERPRFDAALIREIVRDMNGQTITRSESEAIELVCVMGSGHGYGNLIAWLSTAWQLSLMQNHGMSREQAAASVHGTPYPLPERFR